jgi:hypothetical protein
MLKSLVIASGSGLVLYEKEWTKEFELVTSCTEAREDQLMLGAIFLSFRPSFVLN